VKRGMGRRPMAFEHAQACDRGEKKEARGNKGTRCAWADPGKNEVGRARMNSDDCELFKLISNEFHMF
jgi:hypothetical protein